MFVNPEVPIDSLPGAVDVDWQALHPRFARRQQLGTAVGWGLIATAVGALHGAHAAWGDAELPMLVPAIAWSAIALLAVTALLWPRWDVPRRGYVVRDHDIVYKSGVLWRSVKAVPYSRVQHAETASSPIDRRFGLARLVVYTAGGSGGDLRIDGLASDLAEQLRAYVAERLAAPPRSPPDSASRSMAPPQPR